MASNPKCPFCNFITHPTHSNGNVVTYVCERCGALFTKTK